MKRVVDYTITPTTYTYRLQGAVHKSNVVWDRLYNAAGFEPLQPPAVQKQFDQYPTTNFDKLYTKSKLSRTMQRPVKIKMLSRDFIEDSLYNAKYGYFNNGVEIYHPDTPFEYTNYSTQDEFIDAWQLSYGKYKDKSLQLWHTPTELFHPHYGQLLLRYMLVNYMLSQYPYQDLVIYEMGGGNGTLMMDILDYIEQANPEVYANTKYKVIEISTKLSQRQQHTKHKDKIQIINKSIFEWQDTIHDPCFFIALEVFDNFSHDVIRYDVDTNEPHQGYVLIDNNGDFKEFFHPKLDNLSQLFLSLRESTKFSVLNSTSSSHPLHRHHLVWNKLKCSLNPFKSNLSDAEYIPTRLLQFFHILKNKFPQHQLLSSDFHNLPNTIPGFNSPVVQTVLNGKMITMDTYMVQQGYFDILFPTNFELASELYTLVVGKLARTTSHRQFLEQWADVNATQTQKGENPMLDFYQNASFLLS